MNENFNAVKRREWVKNAAIIFLSVMLVLTFFSNTIMNYSLPEVATEYVQRGTITAKVRGTGNIEATDPYNVSIGESRVISGVAVKAGDEIKKGDVLFYLEDEESTELLDAQKELNSLILAYQVAVITESMGVGTVNNIENDNTVPLTQKQQKLQAAIAAQDAAQAEYDSATLQVAQINKELGIIGNTVVDTSNEKNAVSNAQKEANNAGKAVAEAQAEASKASENVTIAKNNVTVKEVELSDAKAAIENIQNLKNIIDNFSNERDAAQNAVTEANNAVSAAQGILDERTAALESWKANHPDAGPAELEEQQKSVDAAAEELKAAQDALKAAQDAIPALEQSYQGAMDAYNTAGGDGALAELTNNAAVKENELAQAKQAVIDAENKVAEANKEVANKTNEQSHKNAAVTNAQQSLTDKENSLNTTVDKANVSNRLLEAQDRQTKAQLALDKAKEEMADLQKGLLAEINLESQDDAIRLQMEKIKKLEEKSVGAAIEAPVDGIVTSIGKAAGEKTQPEETLAVIQVAGKGFTLAFSATAEQAKKLSVGDIAEVQNSWYYEDVKATLTSIKPDPNDPAQKKLLTFNVEGDVQAGQSLSLAVGQKSADYELVVPNSAVREDNNGKFILIVESKSSPLGNRYVATRIDVEVLASDDTHTAVSAGLYGHEYVITTATKPVEAGKQVRLTD